MENSIGKQLCFHQVLALWRKLNVLLIKDVFQDLDEMDTLALKQEEEQKNKEHEAALTLAFNLTPDSNGDLQIDGPIKEILEPNLGANHPLLDLFQCCCIQQFCLLTQNTLNEV